MASWYSVVRWYPDLVRGECVNIGVVVFDEKQVLWKTLDNWERARQFGGFKVTNDPFLDVFSGFEVQNPKSCREWLESNKGLSSVQNGEICASLLPVEQLLDDAVKRFLVN